MSARSRVMWAILALGALAGHAMGQDASASAASPGDPAVRLEFTNPALSPPHWTLTLHPDGSGNFRSQAGTVVDGDPQYIREPEQNRDFQVSARYAAHVFETARQHRWFSVACESHLKVAFTGWKKLVYSGPGGQGSCVYNYSKDKEIEALGESLMAVAQTMLEGARLEILLQHDRLGLDSEMQALQRAVQEGRAQQVDSIRETLQKLADDPALLERVRRRARLLLVQPAR